MISESSSFTLICSELDLSVLKLPHWKFFVSGIVETKKIVKTTKILSIFIMFVSCILGSYKRVFLIVVNEIEKRKLHIKEAFVITSLKGRKIGHPVFWSIICFSERTHDVNYCVILTSKNIIHISLKVTKIQSVLLFLSFGQKEDVSCSLFRCNNQDWNVFNILSNLYKATF